MDYRLIFQVKFLLFFAQVSFAPPAHGELWLEASVTQKTSNCLNNVGSKLRRWDFLLVLRNQSESPHLILKQHSKTPYSHPHHQVLGVQVGVVIQNQRVALSAVTTSKQQGVRHCSQLHHYLPMDESAAKFRLYAARHDRVLSHTP